MHFHAECLSKGQHWIHENIAASHVSAFLLVALLLSTRPDWKR
jgi:hypothetical protein